MTPHVLCCILCRRDDFIADEHGTVICMNPVCMYTRAKAAAERLAPPLVDQAADMGIPWTVLVRSRRREAPIPRCIRGCERDVSEWGRRCRFCAAREIAQMRKARTPRAEASGR